MFPVGLANLESLNLSFTVVEDVGLRKLSGLSSLKSLNLDVRQITDNGLAALTSKYYDIAFRWEQNGIIRINSSKKTCSGNHSEALPNKSFYVFKC